MPAHINHYLERERRNKGNKCPQIWPQFNLIEALSQLKFSFPRDSNCVKLTKMTQYRKTLWVPLKVKHVSWGQEDPRSFSRDHWVFDGSVSQIQVPWSQWYHFIDNHVWEWNGYRHEMHVHIGMSIVTYIWGCIEGERTTLRASYHPEKHYLFFK